jgi:hypothetical protein
MLDGKEGPDDKDPWGALLWYWNKGRESWQHFTEVEENLHQALYARWPKLARAGSAVLHNLYKIIIAPAFSVILAFLLVDLVLSGASIIASVSAYTAWLIAVVWIARSQWVNSLRILRRFGFVLLSALLMAFPTHWYVEWTLLNITKHSQVQPQPGTAASVGPNSPPEGQAPISQPTASLDTLAIQSVIRQFNDEMRRHGKQAPPTSAQPAIPSKPQGDAVSKFSDWSTPELRMSLHALADSAKSMADLFWERDGSIENTFVLASDFYGRDFSADKQAKVIEQIAQDRQKLREENGSACYQMRTDVVSLVTVLITREKVLPDQPEPSCFQTGKVSDSKQWTEVQTYLESIDKKIMQ